MMRATSNGYVRNKFTVLPGGRPAPTEAGGNAALAFATGPEASDGTLATRLERMRAARIKSYEGDSCAECGNFTLVRNGTDLKYDAGRGATSACS
jgi:ribonucleoside-diphosphate reductase alpha chain